MISSFKERFVLRPTKHAVAFIGLALFFTLSLHAATITGTVKGPDGAPFMGAFVQAQNTKTKITVNVLSHKDGKYHVDDLPPGEYEIHIRAIGYQADPRLGVNLKKNQKASFDWQLQKGTVRWRDLTLYQGEKLLPNVTGKEMMFGPTARGGRDAPCQICHGFQSRMASTVRDEAGWRDRVDYMRSAMHPQLRITDEQEDHIVSFLTALFGPNSILPKSPSDLPQYKDLVPKFNADAMNIVYVEYDLAGPNRMPWSAAPDKDGIVWMPFYGRQNKIGRLDPETGETKEYTVPNTDTALVHSAYPAPDGSIWGAEFGANKLARLDPKTGAITEFQDAYLPGKEGTIQGGSKHTVRVGTDGIAWSSGFPVSRFDPKTGEFKHFEDGTYGVTLDKNNNCWFTEYSPVGKIGRIDAETLKEQTWTPPTDGRKIYSRRIQVDADGTIWFSESDAGEIGHFDPKTETFKQYQLPGPNPSPYAMNLDREHHVWYSSEYLDEVGRLDPATGKVVEYPFPHNEITSREYFLDAKGRMWYATPANNKVGYFYLASK
jgi:virginiamycin B lyase